MATPPAVPEKELRIALVCYGGVSLAVYMHGVTKELWKLLRASEARRRGQGAPPGDTEPVWTELLDALAAEVDLRVVCDTIAGASAGGLNGLLLGVAIVEGLDLEPLTELWLAEADVDRLLDPAARPGGPLVRLYKEPVAWLAARQAVQRALAEDPEAGTVARRLAAFVRTRWFKPPFSGPGLVAAVDRALEAMRRHPAGPALLPPTSDFDLFVTVTDYHGRARAMPIHSPPVVWEVEHRRVLSFHAPATAGIEAAEGAPDATARRLGSRGSLLFAARATASFPGAFPAASVGEIDRHLAAAGAVWEDRAAFLARQLAGDLPPEDVRLIDGSVLMNAPFGPAIEAIRLKPALREVDRRFVYLDPKPGLHLFEVGPARDRPPGFLAAMLRALAQLPREQPIRDNLEAIGRLSAQLARIRDTLDSLAPTVERAMDRALGLSFLWRPLTASRLAAAQARIPAAVAREAGLGFLAYRRLRLSLLLEDLARALGVAAGLDTAATAGLLDALRQAPDVAAALARPNAEPSPEDPTERLLERFDLEFRLRRLRFVIRRLNRELARLEGAARTPVERLKAGLHAAIGAGLARRGPERPDLADVARQLAGRPDAAAARRALETLGAVLDLPAWDAAVDARLLATVGDRRLPRAARRLLVRDWLGFPFFDVVLLPLLGETGFDSLEEIKVDRISPEDSPAVCPGGTRAVLKGWHLAGFGAFFSRAWRENDYLWGRLNAADRLVDILASTRPGSGPWTERWKRALVKAILAAEEERLSAIGPLVSRLKEAWG
ncbi:MAG: patatin-like protein [Sphingomonadaceae bacterium]|uniref:patatin-like protein n=1 Tax=Thermaurantiacus sp. TaxID=2820283 RepID=UPI00298F047B|nr:patatin-like protein [Thermaurantiacus sp.]MCS6987280.1 patatin-like protein [Sphingomonadaceae bacterium]MDW8414500.1 patatin-like protein [Thermaurantiacus sp.]